MIKDTFFSLSRFNLLLKKDIMENWKSYVLRILLIFGIIFIALSWNGYFAYKTSRMYDPSHVFTAGVFMVSLFIFGSLSASYIMEKMKSKTDRISYLMIPATAFEKYFMRWLIYTIVFLGIYFLMFKMADCTKTFIFRIIYPENTNIEPFSFSYITSTTFKEKDELLIFIGFYILNQSTYVLGSILWPKNSFLKTFAANIIIIFVYGIVATYSFHLFFVNKTVEVGFISDPSELWLFIPSIVLGVTFWIIAYYRFKESEIINRI